MFFMAAMLLVSTFRENFAILRRSASQEKKTTKQFFVFEVKKTANGNQTIIGKRNNDDGYCLLHVCFCCCLSMLFCLMETILFVYFLKFSAICGHCLTEHVTSSRWSCQRSLITSAQDGVVRCTAASPCCAFAEPGDFWWFLGGWPHLTKPLCHCVNWWAGRARCFFDCNPADLQCFSQNFWQSLGDPFWLLTSTIKAIR